MQKHTSSPKQSNKGILINIFFLVLFGLVALSSASSVIGHTQFGDSYYFLKHQILYGLLPGVILFFIFSKIPPAFWKKNAKIFFIATLGLMALVFIPGFGVEYNNARSWVLLFGFSLQPSEIMKLALVIFLSAWLSSKRSITRKDLFVFLGVLIVTLGLIALQPDIGTLIIAAMIALVIYFISGAPVSHILTLFALGFSALIFMIKIAPYRLARLTAFLNPDIDPQGAGYHINQALVAVGSGGIFGQGLGHSKQKFLYLPEVAGDSIFAIMAEEFGFIIMVIFMLVYLSLIINMLKHAKQTPDIFQQLFLSGVAAWLGLQAIVNIGAMIGLLPLTGVPLPLISFGGTSLMIILAALGISYAIINNKKYK